MRLICNADRLAHTNELFKELYILKFPEFVQYKTAILMFHLFHGTLPIHLQNRFSRYSTTRSTRRINTCVMVQARTNIKAMCLSVYGVKLWNSLSNNLRDCNSVIIFKKNLKKYCITPIFRVEEIFAIFANLDFARNFPPAKIISTANGISRNFLPAKFSSPRN